MSAEDLNTQPFQEEPATTSNQPFFNPIPLQVGDVLCGIYWLTARLGRGGMGEVWKADELFEGKVLRTVVIKTILPEVQNTQQEMARVEAMFHKIHGFQHEHICPMYALKSDPKVGTFLVMKYIQGKTLNEYWEEYMKTHTTFPVSEVVRLLLPVAQALDYSHHKMVLHRDVKPQNILISDDPNDGIQLIDFGLVMDLTGSITSITTRSHDSSSTSGTLPYMSPEQLAGLHQTEASDEYSLATVAYELLAGTRPFTGDTFQSLSYQIMNVRPSLIPGVPFQTNAVLQKGLDKNRRKRWKTCTEFIEALEKSASKNSWSSVAIYCWHSTRKRWDVAIALGLVFLLAFLFLWYKWEQKSQTPVVENQEISTVSNNGTQPSEVPPKETPQPPTIPESSTPKETTQTRIIHGVPFTFCWCPVSENGFWMLETEVTQQQWAAVMGGVMAPYPGKDMPMTMISFHDAEDFAIMLSEQLGTEVQIPNETQWERACRAENLEGNGLDYSLENRCWFNYNSGGRLHPCKSKGPNEWGLYDMQGNVNEWLMPGQTVPEDPTFKKGETAVIRGGCAWDSGERCAFKSRQEQKKDQRTNAIGVRVLIPNREIPKIDPQRQIQFYSIPVKDNTVLVTTNWDEEDFLNEDVSLREALMAVPENGTILFDKKLDGAIIHIRKKPLVITRGVIVDASDLPKKITLDGDNKNSLVHIGYTEGQSPVVFNNVVFQNAQGYEYAAMKCQECTTVLKHCVVRHCVSGGAPIRKHDGALFLEDCLLEENQSTGAYRSIPNAGVIGAWRGHCRLINCRVLNNQINGDGGGFALYSGSGILSGCLFAGNSAIRGGAVTVFDIENNYLSVNNCTFSGNTASQKGGAIITNKAYPKINSSILVGNRATADPEICVVTGSVWGTNNISDWNGWQEPEQASYSESKPLFVDEKNHDFHLCPDSQAIDAGAGKEPAKTDLDGNPRVSGKCIDTGAYEFQEKK